MIITTLRPPTEAEAALMKEMYLTRTVAEICEEFYGHRTDETFWMTKTAIGRPVCSITWSYDPDVRDEVEGNIMMLRLRTDYEAKYPPGLVAAVQSRGGMFDPVHGWLYQCSPGDEAVIHNGTTVIDGTNETKEAAFA